MPQDFLHLDILYLYLPQFSGNTVSQQYHHIYLFVHCSFLLSLHSSGDKVLTVVLEIIFAWKEVALRDPQRYMYTVTILSPCFMCVYAMLYNK